MRLQAHYSQVQCRIHILQHNTDCRVSMTEYLWPSNTLNWLPIIERRDLAMLKISHKALHDDTWPEYLHLKFHTVSVYNLRSLEAPKLAIPAESSTLQDSAARLFISYLIS